jgi:hypothetical protein
MRDHDREFTYKWYKLRFFCKLYADGSFTIVAFDLASDVLGQFKDAIGSILHPQIIHDPFLVHLKLLEESIATFDMSVWSLRDLVRDVEVARVCINPTYYSTKY